MAANDLRMKCLYEETAALKGIGVDFQFQPGELVLVKQLKIGKLLPKCMGPFTFLRYKGRLKAVA